MSPKGFKEGAGRAALRVYLHEVGEGRFCGTGDRRAKVQIKSVA